MNKLILGASMVVSATTLSFAQQVERPNIVIVLADDLDGEMSDFMAAR